MLDFKVDSEVLKEHDVGCWAIDPSVEAIYPCESKTPLVESWS